MQFKGTHEALPSIAQVLHANWVVEGSVVRNGNHVRITAQLIDASSDSHLWAGSYEHDYNNILSLQDDVAGDVAMSVLERARGSEASLRPQAAPVVPEARVAYLKGRFYWNERDEPGLKQGIIEFNQAIKAAPSYAPAYAGLADCYNLLSVWGSLAPNEAFPLAKQAALKALQLDPSSAEAHTALAFETYRYDWDFGGAEKEFQKAIVLNPNYATAHQWYGEFLADLARFDQGIAELRRAQELDPLSSIVGSDLAAALIHARRAQEAIAELEQVFRTRPDFAPAHLYLAAAYGIANNPAKSRQELLLYSKLSGDQGPVEALHLREDVASGKQQAAQELYDRIAGNIREGRSGNFQMAALEVSMGRSDRAFGWLDKAYREHSWWLVTLLVEPALDPLRNDPRFHALLQRVGIPH
jgi:Tfp pilus assembly protein PilF